MKKFKETKIYNYFKEENRFKNILINTSIMILIIALVVPLQYTLGINHVKDENIFLIFTVAVILILIKTKNIIYGIISSLAFVLFFNFLNADPIFTLSISDPNYYLSFLIFIVVSLIVGTLVIDLQRQNKQAVESNKKVNAMYDLSSKLLNNHDRPIIYNYVIKFLYDNLKIDFSIVDIDKNIYGEIKLNEELETMMNFCLDKNIVVGKDAFTFKDSEYLAFPIRSKENYYGVVFAKLTDKDMSKDEIEFIQQNIYHLVVALDREYAIKEQQNAKVDVEREKLKNALLRSLSHDLKTPLTSIKSGSDFLISSYDKIDDEAKKEIISDIYHEACDLNEFIVNLLNMTKLNQDKSLVNRKKEPVDEIINSLKNKITRKLENRTLEFEANDELLFVYADAVLIEQVLGNLISNALKHTKQGTNVIVKYYHADNGVNFEVIDNGGGIKDSALDKIFEDFYTLALKQDHHRGTGLGLSICKAIVEAHDGEIRAYNNDIGGATFTFNIPDKNEEESNGQ